jgi:hypothetical protein
MPRARSLENYRSTSEFGFNGFVNLLAILEADDDGVNFPA